MPFLAFGLSVSISLLLIPVIRRGSLRRSYLAQPREDRWHRAPTPVLGGVGIFAAFVLSLLVISLVYGERAEIRWGLMAGSALMFLLGVYDDLRQITQTDFAEDEYFDDQHVKRGHGGRLGYGEKSGVDATEYEYRQRYFPLGFPQRGTDFLP